MHGLCGCYIFRCWLYRFVVGYIIKYSSIHFEGKNAFVGSPLQTKMYSEPLSNLNGNHHCHQFRGVNFVLPRQLMLWTFCIRPPDIMYIAVMFREKKKKNIWKNNNLKVESEWCAHNALTIGALFRWAMTMRTNNQTNSIKMDGIYMPLLVLSDVHMQRDRTIHISDELCVLPRTFIYLCVIVVHFSTLSAVLRLFSHFDLL